METEFLDPIDKFRFKRITPKCNHYVIYPDPTAYTNNAVTMTGAAVTKSFNIPSAHRINKVVLCHLSALYALSTDALIYELTCKQGLHNFLPKFEDTLLARTTGAGVSKVIEVFGEAYEYEQRTWTLSLNTTATDLVIPLIYVQLVGSEGYT
jgi:hypothetical protein